MVGRVKFQVWSETKQRWQTAYVRYPQVMDTLKKLRGYGIRVEVVTERVDSLPFVEAA